MAPFASPFTSATRVASGAASARRPSRIAVEIVSGSESCSPSAARASASTSRRVRSSVAATSWGSGLRCMRRRYRRRRMDTAELDYDLPPELIAQRPAERRDASRLLVFDRATGDVRHRTFRDLPAELPPGTLTVVNDTRVVPARIPIARPRGEVLLLEPVGDEEWLALARPTRKLRPGRRYGPVELLEHVGEGRWRVRLDAEPAGETPLPPYITEPLEDPERYQTVYAADRARPPRRRPASISRTGSSRSSTSPA